MSKCNKWFKNFDERPHRIIRISCRYCELNYTFLLQAVIDCDTTEETPVPFNMPDEPHNCPFPFEDLDLHP